MATSFFYINVMTTSFFYMYIDIYIDIYIYIYNWLVKKDHCYFCIFLSTKTKAFDPSKSKICQSSLKFSSFFAMVKAILN